MTFEKVLIMSSAFSWPLGNVHLLSEGRGWVEIRGSTKNFGGMEGCTKKYMANRGGLGKSLGFSKISTHPPPAYIKWTFPYWTIQEMCLDLSSKETWTHLHCGLHSHGASKWHYMSNPLLSISSAWGHGWESIISSIVSSNWNHTAVCIEILRHFYNCTYWWY